MAEIIKMPKLGFDMAEGTLIRWVKNEGESVEKGELIAEIETDKATVEVESLYSGTVRKHLVAESAIVPVNTPIIVIGSADEEIDLAALTGEAEAPTEAAPAAVPPQETAHAQPEQAPPAAIQADVQLPDGVRASPLARKIAKDKSVNLTLLSGSGPKGRIIKADVEAALNAPQTGTTASPVPSTPADLGPVREDKRVPLTRLRQAIGRRMVDSKQNFPHFYVTSEVDLGPLMELRKQANAMLEDRGEKLSVNDFIVKATALALAKFPNLNAALDGDSVVQFGNINVGIAVAVENGLLTVVTHNADRKSVRQISQEVKAKAGRARAGKVHPDDVSGSTFSVSNLGMFNVDHFIAIINPPEAAILAIGSGKQVPVVVDGELTVGWRMKGTISVDHRVSDGAEAAQFMAAWVKLLENPLHLMLE
ncbi:MAG: dihydrolipoamide acetyltransferase family protein [Chloroflexota bacterium]